MWIAGVIALGIGFYIATNMAPLITQSAADAGFAMPENASQITSIADGFLWPPFLFARFGSLFGGFGVIVIAVVLAVAWYFYLHHQRAWNVLAGAPKEEVGAAAD
jgi:PTS system galactitol-specific IIC component